METKKIDESVVNKNWDALLKIFHGIVENNPEDAKEQMLSLKELAKSKDLTPRQAEGIAARCDNFIKGEFGNTKTTENLNRG